MPDLFGIECLDKSRFFIGRDSSSYLGCCAVDANSATDGVCPHDDIRPATFNRDAYNKIPSQDCIGQETGVFWYTCSDSKPPFLGCCAINPCVSGHCPSFALKPARLSSNEEKASAFLSGGSEERLPVATFTVFTSLSSSLSSLTTSTPRPSSSSISSFTTSSSVSVLSPTATITSVAASDQGGFPPVTAVAMTTGLVAGVIAVVALLILWRVRRTKKLPGDCNQVAPVPQQQQQQQQQDAAVVAELPGSSLRFELPA